MALNEDYITIGQDIIGASFEVMKNAGRFMRERYYEASLTYELIQRGYDVRRQVTIPALYKGIQVEDSYIADVVVDGRVIIEIKAIPYMKDEEWRQLMSYLKLSGFKLGYLINFGAKDFSVGKSSEKSPYLKGIYRLVNNI